MSSHLPNPEFQFDENFCVNEEVLEAFKRNGYIIVRKLLSGDEVGRLRSALEHPEGVMGQEKHYLEDGAGKRVRFSQWRHPGNDITGTIARAHKVAGTFEKLLGCELYHYHGKVISKEPKTGGTHVWHQDYGYWYQFGCLYPDMGTVWISVDRADRENGCVQLLAGSHHLGRLDHGKVGDQAGCDEERVRHIQRLGTCPLVFCETEPGDAFFFHSNVLHRSNDNTSERRRWAYLVAYNGRHNDPVLQHHHPFYTPLEKVEDSEILKCANDIDMTGKEFSARDPKRISPFMPREATTTD